jgi:hypothetical protein
MGKRGEKRERRSAILEPDAAGIGIGAEEIYVAVPPDRDEQASALGNRSLDHHRRACFEIPRIGQGKLPQPHRRVLCSGRSGAPHSDPVVARVHGCGSP